MNNYTERDTITEIQMKKWMDNEKNVLIFGDHGVGKTTLVTNFWERLGLNYAFFSGSTLDPWVDLIGVPKLVKKGKDSFIEFALPQTIDENLEAIFIDEYNRSPSAVRNAILELIQFKSINGRSFPNLKVVWAAANPPDADNSYDVEEIDPAQEDRFHVIIKLSGKPSMEYFSSRFGEEVAKGALNWHQNLAPEIKKLISPRRLDYAIDYVINCDGEARDILPDERINISAFSRSIKGNKHLKELLELKEDKNFSGLQGFFKEQKKVQPCLKEILRNFELSNLFIKYGNTEEVIAYANADEKFSTLVYSESTKDERLKKALDGYFQANKKNPQWFDQASRSILASKATMESYLEYRPFFVESGLDLKVSDLSTLLSFKSIEEIVDGVNCMGSASIYVLNEDSAANVLSFFGKIDFADFCRSNKGSEWIKKAYSLIYSAFDFYYLRDANLLGATFSGKGCEKLTASPPFIMKTSGAGGTGTRGNSGRMSIKEQIL